MTEEPYKVGYGKPPKHTQFGAGETGNASGKTSAQRKSEYANAEKATLLRGRMLDAVIEATSHGDKATLEFIEAGVLKLLKDVEDRAHGTPKQSVDNTSSDGSMTPRATSDAVIAALKAKHDPKPE
jgi:hypothetical protein